jgi:hypothetical protein
MYRCSPERRKAAKLRCDYRRLNCSHVDGDLRFISHSLFWPGCMDIRDKCNLSFLFCCLV